MPIEIKELVVRFNITESQDINKQHNNYSDLSHGFYKKLVKDCVKGVMKEIERRKER